MSIEMMRSDERGRAWMTRSISRAPASLGMALVTALLAACSSAGSPSVTLPTAPGRDLVNEGDLYADAARYGALVFTATFLGDASGDDVAADVTNALDQLEAALEASGAGLDTLLKVNIDLTDWETFDATYRARIAPLGLPPRTTVEVSQLGLDAPIEIAAVARVCAP